MRCYRVGVYDGVRVVWARARVGWASEGNLPERITEERDRSQGTKSCLKNIRREFASKVLESSYRKFASRYCRVKQFILERTAQEFLGRRLVCRFFSVCVFLFAFVGIDCGSCF